MEIKVIQVPGRTSTVELPDGSTVGEALNAADVALGANEACKVNGVTAGLDHALSEGDKVIVSKGAKGNI